MERNLPSPAWASNVYFNSRWTNFSLSPSLSLHGLFEGCAQKSWALCADTTSLSLRTLGEISGNTFEKIRFSSGHGVQTWWSRQLQPCCEQLSSLTQPTPRLSEGGFPASRCFQWLEQTKVRKRSTREIFVSTLNDWFLCSDFLTEVCSRARTAGSINCRVFFFFSFFFLLF